MSGAVFEWLSSNTKTAYPFEERQPDDIHELFVDAYVIHNKFREKERLRIDSVDLGTGDLTLKFGDGATLIVLTVADDFTSTVFGAFTVYEWKRTTTMGVGFTDEDLTARLVVLSSEISNFVFPLAPSNGFLLASLVNPRISRVRRLAIAIPGIACCIGGGFTSNQVIFEAGNNLEIVQEQVTDIAGLGIVDVDTVRVATQITFNAAAGLGSGQFITCDTTVPPLKRVNSTGPDDKGNFLLEGRDCLWVERLVDTVGPPVNPNTDLLATVEAALLQLHQDCEACCACEEYGAAYEKIAQLWKDAQEAAARIEAVRLDYNLLVPTILGIKISKETGIGVNLQAMIRPDFHLGLSAIVFNNSETDITGVVELKFSLDVAGFTYTPQSGQLDAESLHNLQIDPAISGLDLIVTVPGLRSTKYATYSFDVRYGPTLSPRAGVTIRPSVLVTSNIGAVADAKVVQLSGPLEKF